MLTGAEDDKRGVGRDVRLREGRPFAKTACCVLHGTTWCARCADVAGRAAHHGLAHLSQPHTNVCLCSLTPALPRVHRSIWIALQLESVTCRHAHELLHRRGASLLEPCKYFCVSHQMDALDAMQHSNVSLCPAWERDMSRGSQPDFCSYISCVK